MKNLYNLFKTDKNLEMNGVVLDFGGPQIRLRRAGGANRLFNTTFNDVSRPYAQAMAARALDPDKQRDMLIDVYFRSVVLGWDNVTDEDNKPLEFNVVNFKKVMVDLPDLWDVVRSEADNLRNFQLASAKEDGKLLGE